jgi:predicted dinucleotide-binding enzyme
VRFGILGTGVVGKTIAVRLDGLGHDVIVGTRNPEETLSRTDPDQYGHPPFGAWQEEHPEVRLGTFAEAAAHGDMVVNATAGAVSLEALEQAGEDNLNGKILIDIANPLDFSKGMPLRSWCRTPTPSASRSSGGSLRRRWSRPCTL